MPKNKIHNSKRAEGPLSAEGLVRTIIAVILVIIALKIGGKALKAFTGESSESYEEFLISIEEISMAESGTDTSQLLELDSGTAVLVFPEDTNEVVVEQQKGPPPRSIITFSKPDGCEGASSCVCMCKEIEYEGGGAASCTSVTSCQSLNFPVIGICKIESIVNFKWKCTQGVIIERGLKENRNSYLFLGPTNGAVANEIASIRDRVITIENIGDNAVAICENPDPITGCEPQP